MSGHENAAWQEGYAAGKAERKPTPTDDELRDTLVKYEGCVSRVERDGDDSDEAVKELADAREALMSVLRAARDKING